MKRSQPDKQPLRRSAYTLLAVVAAVVLLVFTLAFFQIKKGSGPVHGKILRHKIITHLAAKHASDPDRPSQQTSRSAQVEKTGNKNGAFVSVARLVPEKMYSYNDSTPKLAVLNDIDLDLTTEHNDYTHVIGVTTKEVKKEFILVLLADRAINGYNSFFLDAPPRFVVDLSGKWAFPREPELKLKGELAKSVRFGKHPDLLRIVIDLTGSVSRPPTIKTSSQGLFVTLKGI